jgi:hypothetical protein
VVGKVEIRLLLAVAQVGLTQAVFQLAIWGRQYRNSVLLQRQEGQLWGTGGCVSTVALERVRLFMEIALLL